MSSLTSTAYLFRNSFNYILSLLFDPIFSVGFLYPHYIFHTFFLLGTSSFHSMNFSRSNLESCEKICCHMYGVTVDDRLIMRFIEHLNTQLVTAICRSLLHILVSSVTVFTNLLAKGFQRRAFTFHWVPEISPFLRNMPIKYNTSATTTLVIAAASLYLLSARTA
jgi:hypothetical protein